MQKVLKNPAPKVPQETLLYSTNNTSLCQCDVTESFMLTFYGSQLSFRVCELIAFRRKIQQVNIVDLLESDTPDVEIIDLPCCNRMFVLSVRETLELKELFSGAFVMLELNSLIHSKIIRKGI